MKLVCSPNHLFQVYCLWLSYNTLLLEEYLIFGICEPIGEENEPECLMLLVFILSSLWHEYIVIHLVYLQAQRFTYISLFIQIHIYHIT